MEHVNEYVSFPLMYKLVAIPIKITVGFFKEFDTFILKFIWNNKGTRIAKLALKKKSKREHLSFWILTY